MHDLAKTIIEDIPKKDKISIYFLGGAGFLIKSNKVFIGVDLYLSDFYFKENNIFKMFILPPVEPDELKLDYLIATHEHPDHFDTGSLDGFVNEKTNTKIIGPGSVYKLGLEKGIDKNSLIRFDRNQEKNFKNFEARAVFADHGDMSPDSIGVILSLNGKNIYITGDTCYRKDLLELVRLDEKIDLLIVPINGRFGNPGPEEATKIVTLVNPDIVVPCHFWMFKEHGGNPGAFEEVCRNTNTDTTVQVLTIGQRLEV